MDVKGGSWIDYHNETHPKVTRFLHHNSKAISAIKATILHVLHAECYCVSIQHKFH